MQTHGADLRSPNVLATRGTKIKRGAEGERGCIVDIHPLRKPREKHGSEGKRT